MKHTFLESPLGTLLLVGDGDGLAGLYPSRHVRLPEPPGERDDRTFDQARAELQEYFDGGRTAFDVALAPRGTAFQQQVWQQLREIEYGCTASYGQIAQRLGRPSAARAVGMANGRNPISIIVPCHRVVGSSGALTGYAGGTEAKAWLLAHECRGVRTRPA